MRIFVSHCHRDNNWSDPFVAEIQSAGFDVWYDRQNLQIGEQWVKVIEEELTTCNLFIVLLSPDAWASHWVQEEFRLAFASKKPIIGIKIKETNLNGWITTRHIMNAIGQSPEAEARVIIETINAHLLPDASFNGALQIPDRTQHGSGRQQVMLRPDFEYCRVQPLERSITVNSRILRYGAFVVYSNRTVATDHFATGESFEEISNRLSIEGWREVKRQANDDATIRANFARER